MTDGIVPEAFFDCLSLGNKLDKFLDGFKVEELHLFSYFSSILFLYKGNAVSTWGYDFQINSEGYPIALAISMSFDRHLQNGLFQESDAFCTISEMGRNEYNNFKRQQLFLNREPFLDAACTSTVLVPSSQAIRALLRDPSIVKANNLHSHAWLEQSYEMLAEISEAVGGPSESLIIPAVNWINYNKLRDNSH